MINVAISPLEAEWIQEQRLCAQIRCVPNNWGAPFIPLNKIIHSTHEHESMTLWPDCQTLAAAIGTQTSLFYYVNDTNWHLRTSWRHSDRKATTRRSLSSGWRVNGCWQKVIRGLVGYVPWSGERPKINTVVRFNRTLVRLFFKNHAATPGY